MIQLNLIQSDKKIRLWFPVSLGIRLRVHPKTSDFLRLRLRNPCGVRRTVSWGGFHSVAYGGYLYLV